MLVPHYLATGVALLAESTLSPSFANGALSVTFQTVTGRTNLVQYSATLSPPNWQTVSTIVGNGSEQTYTGAATMEATGFYRIVYE